MKNLILSILTLTILSFAVSSCDNDETYADKLEKETKSIKKLLKDSSFYKVNTYPKDRAFNPGEFFTDPATGVLFHVIDSGNGNRAKDKQYINVRYKWGYFFQSDKNRKAEHENSSMGTFHDKLLFRHNVSSTQMGAYNDTKPNFYIKSVGLAAPLKYVGENAIVKIIIPFSTGSYAQFYSLYEPLYVGYVRYEFMAE